MNAAELATEGLLSQEIESLASCIARGQSPDTYQDIVAKARAHIEKLPADRREFWTDQVKTLGVALFPPRPSRVAVLDNGPGKIDKKPGGTSVP